MKRALEREAAERARIGVNVVDETSANAIPLGGKASTQTVQLLPETASTMADISPTIDTYPPQQAKEITESLSTTLRNKNKKKGFKQAMANAVPKRIVFSGDGSASTAQAMVNGSTSGPDTPVPRLVTPSEKQEQGLLPSNMFVTSVEVEGTNWDRKKKKKKRDDYYEALVEEPGADGEGEVILNYNDEAPKPNAIDFDAIEKEWDSFEAISDAECLKEGSFVGWKVRSSYLIFEISIITSIALGTCTQSDDDVSRDSSSGRKHLQHQP